VTARGLANWYAQILGSIFTDSNKPFEVEIVVAEVGSSPADDQIYRITFDGSVAEEHGFVAMGGQSDQVAGVLKQHYADSMPLVDALAAAIEGVSGPQNGERPEVSAGQLEVAVLDRGRAHRKFRRLAGARLEALLAEARQPRPAAGDGAGQGGADSGAAGANGTSGGNGAGGSGPDGDAPPASGPGGSGGGPA
jgi:proteasome alpha subunit